MTAEVGSGVHFAIDGVSGLRAHHLVGHERIGEASRFDFELRSAIDQPIHPKDALSKGAEVAFNSPDGPRAVSGVVTRFTVVMSDHAQEIAYRATVSSRFALLELRRLGRTFSDISAPDIIEQVVKPVGYKVRRHLLASHDKLAYVVQYLETDAAFVRRLCEEHGLLFRFEPGDSGEVLVLEDDTRQSEPALTKTLMLVTRDAQAAGKPIAQKPRFVEARRPGKVTLRDYNVDNPKAPLEASKTAGSSEEQELDVYAAPGGFRAAGEGEGRAELALQALRGDAKLLELTTNMFSLAPGQLLEISEESNYQGLVRPEGKWLVLSQRTEWHANRPESNHVDLVLLPKDVAYRLPSATPRPHAAGVQSCFVAGTKGEEIDPDELGRVYLKFHWDVHGDRKPRDNPPFRVMQPQAPGALVVPRISWEVFTAFEDGDPARPFVLGRSYNMKQPPPVPLPTNKTVTMIASDSSPGRGARAVISMDDKAGKEHLLWHAPFDMSTTIGADRKVQTVNNENEQIGANLIESVGASESVSVHLAWLGSYGSRGINVGAAQTITVGGNFVTNVGPEFVLVAGAVGEQVGNPVSGAANLLKSAAIAAVGAIPVVGPYLGVAAGLGQVAYNASQPGGSLSAGLRGFALSFVPGGDALTSTVFGSPWAMPWDHGKPSEAWPAPGGGGSGAGGGNAGPTGPGPGYRNQQCNAYAEVVGAGYGIVTGAVRWTCLGKSMVIINGSHTTKALSGGMTVLGGMVEDLGSLSIDTKTVASRSVLGAYRGSLGPVNVTTTGEYQLTVKTALNLDVKGTLTLNGGKVTLKVGSSTITATSGGVNIKSSSITFTKKTSQSGSLTHK